MNIAKLISDAVHSYNEQVGDNLVGFRNSYSGRGMYGRECVGITGPLGDCRKVIAMVINDAYDNTGDVDHEEELLAPEFDFRGLVDSLMDWEQDSMGRSDMVLYWSDIKPMEPGVEQFYEHEQCPDCGEDIPTGTASGEQCRNCGHVFVEQVGNDGAPAS